MIDELNLPPDVETSQEAHAAKRASPSEILPEHAPSTRPVSSEGQLDRRNFLKLPLVERRKVMSAQAEQLALYYEQHSAWKEWLEGDLF